MNTSHPKAHTETYPYLKAVANRLSHRYNAVATLTGHCSENLIDVVRRQCTTDWEKAIRHALDTGYPPDDVRAAWCRLEEKRMLQFLEVPKGEPQHGLRSIVGGKQ